MAKAKVCRECGKSMDGEHPAAKTCRACRFPNEKKEEKKLDAMGEVVDIHTPNPVPPPAPPANKSPVFTPFFIRPGDTVSINLKQRKFYRLPRSEFALTPRKWSGIIPDDVDDVQLRMLRIGLEIGDIVKGKVFTGISKEKRTLEFAEKILKLDQVRFRQAIGNMVQHKGLIGGYLPYEIFRHLMRYEDDNEHRRRYLDFLQSAIDHTGPGPVRSTPVINKDISEIVGTIGR